MPLIALAITNCWISLVPSKIVWFTLQGFPGVGSWYKMQLTRTFATAA